MFRPPEPPGDRTGPRQEPGLEIGHHLVLSSAHVCNRTAELLDGWAVLPRDLQPLGVAYTWYGWFVSTYEVEGDAADVIPQELADLQRFARTRNCAWLLFDCDGDEIPGLPTFPW